MTNIPPNSIASIASTSRAAAKGGTSDDQQVQANQQAQNASANAPSGQVDAGDSSQDRHGDGRQVYDVFESSEDEQSQETPTTAEQPDHGKDGGLDLKM